MGGHGKEAVGQKSGAGGRRMMDYKTPAKTNAAAFMEWAEGYYGKYPEGQREDVLEYLLSWNEQYLLSLKDCVKKTYSSQYGKPPDISALDKLYLEASTMQAAKERALRQAILPPVIGTIETDEHKSARLYADMNACGVTMDTPGWFVKVLEYRVARGDYKDAKAQSQPGGVIKTTKDTSNPRPLSTWEELGNIARSRNPVTTS